MKLLPGYGSWPDLNEKVLFEDGSATDNVGNGEEVATITFDPEKAINSGMNFWKSP